MSRATLVSRVEVLEQQMDAVEGRFDRLEVHIAEFRQDLSTQISQLRDEVHAADAATRVDLRAEIRAEGAAIRDGLRKEIRDGDEETRRFMRVLHEDLIDRIKRIGEPR